MDAGTTPILCSTPRILTCSLWLTSITYPRPLSDHTTTWRLALCVSCKVVYVCVVLCVQGPSLLNLHAVGVNGTVHSLPQALSKKDLCTPPSTSPYHPSHQTAEIKGRYFDAGGEWGEEQRGIGGVLTLIAPKEDNLLFFALQEWFKLKTSCGYLLGEKALPNSLSWTIKLRDIQTKSILPIPLLLELQCVLNKYQGTTVCPRD